MAFESGKVKQKHADGIQSGVKFLTGDAEVHQLFLDALMEDIGNAALSWKFRLYYRFRHLIPIPVRQLLQRQRNSGFELPEDWFIPKHTMAKFAKILAAKDVEIVHPWPDSKPFSFVLTHDVETKRGFDLIEKTASIEEKHGLRSAWNVIPHKYVVDKVKLAELRDRGFEIGVHGFNHDGRLFESKRVFQSRAAEINTVADEFCSTGFRAPMVHRDLQQISDFLDFEYDASCFDIDPFQAMPGGVGFIWPFLINEKMVELPYTMPQDHTLFTSLGQTDTAVWQTKFEYLKRNGGMVMMLTHPDYMDSQARLDLYDRFLGEALANGDPWHALPRDVSAWWLERQKAASQHQTSMGSVVTATSNFGRFAISSMASENEEVRIRPVVLT